MLQKGRRCSQTSLLHREAEYTQDITSLLSQVEPPSFTAPLSTTPIQALLSTLLFDTKRKYSVVVYNMDTEARLSGFESLFCYSLELNLGKVTYISLGKVYKFPSIPVSTCVENGDNKSAYHIVLLPLTIK